MLVDALLDFLPQQRADTMILETGKPPVLSRAGERKALSMPGLDGQMLGDIVGELTDDAQREALDASGELELPYRTGKGIEVSVTIRRADSGVRLVFRTREAQARSAGRAARGAASVASDATVASAPQASAPVPAPSPIPATVVVASPGSPAAPLLVAPSSDRITHSGLSSLLERATLQGASDVFITPGVGVHLRIGVDLIELPEPHEGGELELRECFAASWPRLEHELARTGAVDFAIVVGLGPHAGRFRVNLFRQLGGLSAAFRPIRREPPSLRSLGLGEELYELTAFHSGLVLMTGQAGAGKSTTLVALLERLNQTSPRHIITLEDPIEYVYPRGRALIHQRELGVHVDSFGAGLRAALRESPDIILVGEMRDPETISAALTAAETGHLVL